ncbi:MAG: IS200/IS605 family transposase [Leptolyngbyaceae cyanobacterium]
MGQDYRRTRHSLNLINYHFVWIPKRRRPVLRGEIARRLREITYEVLKEHDCSILALEVMPDHVYLFVNAHPDLAPNQIVRYVKGRSARMLRQEFPKLCKLPSLWTRSYFVSTAGNVSSQTIQRYIENQ